MLEEVRPATVGGAQPQCSQSTNGTNVAYFYYPVKMSSVTLASVYGSLTNFLDHPEKYCATQNSQHPMSQVSLERRAASLGRLTENGGAQCWAVSAPKRRQRPRRAHVCRLVLQLVFTLS
ncbi:hypothetical protein Hamer_G007721 [Homarus americanus]|uniref:Uncharacterized protein n=1 Tax=Homarus americanus TaxID=6706 RepID=A0A8J5JMB0_HOMAM|nr:hypothetical protein Hamer_G007721 [Homarus americanus]